MYLNHSYASLSDCILFISLNLLPKICVFLRLRYLFSVAAWRCFILISAICILFSIYMNAICISLCQPDKSVCIIDVDIKQYISCTLCFACLTGV